MAISQAMLLGASLAAGALAVAAVAAPAGERGTAAPAPSHFAALVGASTSILVGEIVGTRAFAFDPGDGGRTVLTEVTVRGRDVLGTRLAQGPPIDHRPAIDTITPSHAEAPREHTFLVHGGLLANGEDGSFSPSSPARHELRVGRGVVVFAAPLEFPSAAVTGPSPVGGRAGLYNTFVARDGRTLVQGRGFGHALPSNLTLGDLLARVAAFRLRHGDEPEDAR